MAETKLPARAEVAQRLRELRHGIEVATAKAREIERGEFSRYLGVAGDNTVQGPITRAEHAKATNERERLLWLASLLLDVEGVRGALEEAEAIRASHEAQHAELARDVTTYEEAATRGGALLHRAELAELLAKLTGAQRVSIAQRDHADRRKPRLSVLEILQKLENGYRSRAAADRFGAELTMSVYGAQEYVAALRTHAHEAIEAAVGRAPELAKVLR